MCEVQQDDGEGEMMKPMTERERLALWDIARYDGAYSIYWTPSTRAKLEVRGFVKVDGQRVRATEEGKAALKSITVPAP